MTLLEQLRHLQVVGRNHLIALRLVPEGEWWPDLTSARALYALDKTHAVAVLSHGDVNVYLSKSSDVEHQMAIFDAIARKALDRQDTRAAISTMIEELEAVISAACPVGKAAPMADSHATVPGEATCHEHSGAGQDATPYPPRNPAPSVESGVRLKET